MVACASRALVVLQTDGGAQLVNVGAQTWRLVELGAHEVGQGVGDGVELVLRRGVGAGLAVLEQRDHQKGHDRGGRVDDQLPGVQVPDQDAISAKRSNNPRPSETSDGMCGLVLTVVVTSTASPSEPVRQTPRSGSRPQG